MGLATLAADRCVLTRTWPQHEPMENPRHPPVSSLDVGVRPRVTVVVPCFNYGRWLAGCVESALSQPGVQVDVVIVDDASTDNSLDVAQGLARCYPGRIRLVAQPRNRGHIPSVNEGMRHVSGDYVVKLDADDLLAPGCSGAGLRLARGLPAGRVRVWPPGALRR